MDMSAYKTINWEKYTNSFFLIIYISSLFINTKLWTYLENIYE